MFFLQFSKFLHDKFLYFCRKVAPARLFFQFLLTVHQYCIKISNQEKTLVKNMKLTGAEILLKSLEEQNVETIFGYPGSSILSVYDHLSNSKIRHILTVHEQGACFCASGYARSTGKVGVVLATSGPGATNLLTGIADAYMDSVPLIAITGNVPLQNLGHDTFQEVDTFGITMPVVKYSYIVKDIASLHTIICEAFCLATTGRPGPILIDIPSNIFDETYTFENIVDSCNRKQQTSTLQIQEIANLIESSSKPFLYLGGGVISSNASQQVLELAQKLQCPIASSFMGLGAIPSNHPNFLGVASSNNQNIENAIKDCDLFICLGARFNSRLNEKFQNLLSKQTKIIHMDIDNAEIDKNFPTLCYCIGDIKEILSQLVPKLKTKKVWLDISQFQIDKGNTKKSNIFLDFLTFIPKVFGDDVIIATDVGLHQIWTAQNYAFSFPRQFLTSGGLGAMGFGMGASIGASIGTQKRVVLITGDGSFNMNFNELATAVANKIPIVIVVLNNKSLGLIRKMQKETYKRHYVESSLNTNINYVALAKSFGACGMKINKNSDFESALQKAKSCDKPFVIDFKISMKTF